MLRQTPPEVEEAGEAVQRLDAAVLRSVLGQPIRALHVACLTQRLDGGVGVYPEPVEDAAPLHITTTSYPLSRYSAARSPRNDGACPSASVRKPIRP